MCKKEDMFEKYVFTPNYSGVLYYCNKCGNYYGNDKRLKQRARYYQGISILYSNRIIAEVGYSDKHIEYRNVSDTEFDYYNRTVILKSKNKLEPQCPTSANNRQRQLKSHQNKSINISPQLVSIADSDTELPNLSIESQARELLIYHEKCFCRSCRRKYQQDTIEDKLAYVFTKDGKEVKVNAQFCNGCKRFFMNYVSFMAYQRLYGPLDVEIAFDANHTEDDEQNSNFAENSILSAHGYSVKAGTSKYLRQQTLRHILEEGIASKHEIIKLITQFIKINKHRFPDACRRWEEDMLFVNQYRIDEQDNVGIMHMKQGGKIRHRNR